MVITSLCTGLHLIRSGSGCGDEARYVLGIGIDRDWKEKYPQITSALPDGLIEAVLASQAQ